MNFTAGSNPRKKVMKAYQLRENDEKNAEIGGHSVLTRCRELVAIQTNETVNGHPCDAVALEKLFKDGKVVFATSETSLTAKSIRTALRCMRRLSHAVLDKTTPGYHRSALFYLESLEDIFGRRVTETTILDSLHVLDCFTAPGAPPQRRTTARLAGMLDNPTPASR